MSMPVELWLIAACVTACGSTQADEQTAAKYSAEQMECVEASDTRALADACRCAVAQRYGRPCRDAGASR